MNQAQDSKTAGTKHKMTQYGFPESAASLEHGFIKLQCFSQ